MTDTAPRVSRKSLDHVVIRFAGDSGDGMQLTGDQFTDASAAWGNDLATFPDYPAEIRAPAGTPNGVSAFQVNIADHDILTHGDHPDVLVAMNPAALITNMGRLGGEGAIIVNSDNFEERDLAKAGLTSNPLEDGTLSNFRVYPVPMTTLTIEAVKGIGVKARDAERSKNFFALGVIDWLYNRPQEPTLEYIEKKFGKKPLVAESNRIAFKAGWNFGETCELWDVAYELAPADLPVGEYTKVSGNVASAWGMIAAGQLAKLPLFLGSYPITPASDILHELSAQKHFGIRSVQCEDEIAGVSSAIGAAFGGHLACTTTSGPGLDLKAEAIGLAVSLELPLVIIDVQRGGPSTGLPTKTEQSDLFLAVNGRHGESPLPVVAARTPSDCFDTAIEASRLALKYRTPVIMLTDGYLANGAEPWKLPNLDDLPDLSKEFSMATENNNPEGDFLPYMRNEHLARPWAVPGTPGLEHRIGGIEKADQTGHISYVPANHQTMTDLREAKIEGIAEDIPNTPLDVVEGSKTLLLGWGGTYGHIKAAAIRLRAEGFKVDHAHPTHLRPFHPDLGDVLRRYDQVLCIELNNGQLHKLVRSEFVVDTKSITKVEGQPWRPSELQEIIKEML